MKKPASAKPTTTKPVAAKKPAPVAACPLPARKPAVRRFLESLGLVARSDPPACPPLSPPAPPTTSAPADKAASKAAKAQAKADKAAAAKAKADKKAADLKAAEAAKRVSFFLLISPFSSLAPLFSLCAHKPDLASQKPGPLAHPPTTAVKCTDVTGALVEIPLAAIKTAVSLAQAGPLVGGKNPVKFPHVFNNREVRPALPHLVLKSC